MSPMSDRSSVMESTFRLCANGEKRLKPNCDLAASEHLLPELQRRRHSSGGFIVRRVLLVAGDRVPDVAAVTPRQGRLEGAEEVVQRPGDDDDVVGVAEANHHHGCEADALEHGNANPNDNAA